MRLYRGEEIETVNGNGSKAMMDKHFQDSTYRDVAGLCKVATIDEIAQQGYSLNPGRYVGVTDEAADDFDFYERLEELNEELESLNAESRELQERISGNIEKLLINRI